MEKMEEEHDELFHYTDREGLEGILRSQALHATHFRDLKDKEEMKRFGILLKERVVKKNLDEVPDWFKRRPFKKEAVEEAGNLRQVWSQYVDLNINLMYKHSIGKEGAHPTSDG
jgi:hypothetical protein